MITPQHNITRDAENVNMMNYDTCHIEDGDDDAADASEKINKMIQGWKSSPHPPCEKPKTGPSGSCLAPFKSPQAGYTYKSNTNTKTKTSTNQIQIQKQKQVQIKYKYKYNDKYKSNTNTNTKTSTITATLPCGSCPKPFKIYTIIQWWRRRGGIDWSASPHNGCHLKALLSVYMNPEKISTTLHRLDFQLYQCY